VKITFALGILGTTLLLALAVLMVTVLTSGCVTPDVTNCPATTPWIEEKYWNCPEMCQAQYESEIGYGCTDFYRCAARNRQAQEQCICACGECP
jgi:hypothetical protein